MEQIRARNHKSVSLSSRSASLVEEGEEIDSQGGRVVHRVVNKTSHRVSMSHTPLPGMAHTEHNTATRRRDSKLGRIKPVIKPTSLTTWPKKETEEELK